jgi:RNA polymerase sigma-70 factor, ECF subfamily
MPPGGISGASEGVLGGVSPELVVEEHADFVYSLCRRLARDEDEAHDLFQESFVRVLKGLPSFQGRASMRTWICQIVINCDRNRRRWWSRLRRNLPVVPLNDPVEDAGAGAPEPRDGAAGPERRAISREIRDRVDASLGRLPADQRLAVVLRDVEGMSYEEIAAATGAGVGTVKSRIGRARASLRRSLADLVERSGLEVPR